MEHSHREMTVTAAEFLEVRGLEHLSPLVQEIEPMYRLRLGNDRLVETKRTEGTKRVRAEAESGSERLELLRLFIDRRVPADETEALRRRQSGNACATIIARISPSFSQVSPTPCATECSYRGPERLRVESSRYRASGETPISSASLFHSPRVGSAPSFHAIQASRRAPTVFKEAISDRFLAL